jgi:VanZ family protein
MITKTIGAIMERDEPAIGPIEQFVAGDTDVRITGQTIQPSSKIDAFNEKIETKLDSLLRKIGTMNMGLKESLESLSARRKRQFFVKMIGFIGMTIAIVVTR